MSIILGSHQEVFSLHLLEDQPACLEGVELILAPLEAHEH